jgi:hypothetical protein
VAGIQERVEREVVSVLFHDEMYLKFQLVYLCLPIAVLEQNFRSKQHLGRRIAGFQQETNAF